MARIVVLSDIHLSPSHGFFWDNWRIVRDYTNQIEAKAVIINGDVSINGPDSDAELAFAASAFKGLRDPVLALPGNHDIGDEPPGQDPRQIIDQARLARWSRTLGPDRWTYELGDWLLIGVNAQLFGSDLARENEQNRWLDEKLTAGIDRLIVLFLHKPLFLDHPDEDEPTAACLGPAARGQLLERLYEAGVRLVISGHLHQYRDRILEGIRHVWAPAVAFAAPEMFGGDPGCGLLVLDLTGDRVDIGLHRPDGLISHNLAAIKEHGRYKFVREMPPCPPQLA
jgi:3',5'-cyclic AMP phosphodiesterase CpdA